MDEVVQGAAAAVLAGAQAVGVAHRRWSGAADDGAADDGAAEVAGGQGAALGGGDGAGDRVEPGDLAEGAEQDPGDARVAQDRLDPGAGLRAGPGRDGAGVLGRHRTGSLIGVSPGYAGGDQVGEAHRQVPAAAHAVRAVVFVGLPGGQSAGST
jgi:hypothetical protein